MRIGDGQTDYEWVEDWAQIPDSDSASTGWAHHDVVVTASGDVISFHPGDSTMLVFDTHGNLTQSWATNFADAHGMTIVTEGGTEYLWVADNGRKRSADLGYEYTSATKRGGPPVHATETRGQAVKLDLRGELVQAISRPDLAIYETGVYSPTSIAVNAENGDVWVADGYGMSYVHRFDRAGHVHRQHQRRGGRRPVQHAPRAPHRYPKVRARALCRGPGQWPRSGLRPRWQLQAGLRLRFSHDAQCLRRLRRNGDNRRAQREAGRRRP